MLHGVLHNTKSLSEMVDAEDSPLTGLLPTERARAQSLVKTTLRNLAPLDTVLNRLLTKKPPLQVLNILRLCAAELLIDGIAAHAAVDGAVTLARSKQKANHLSGLVNAVSRRLAEVDRDEFAALPVQPLVKYLRVPVTRAYGEEAASRIDQAHGQEPSVDITLRRPQEAEKWASLLEADILPSGSLRLRNKGQISALEGYESGDWWVQDAAAAVPVALFGNVDGLSVLDLCSAPGGKTMQLAAAGAKVTAVDISGDRLKRVQDNLDRTGLSAELVEADAFKWTPAKPFDAILLDAPCSATGTIRRHPDLPFVRRNWDLQPVLRMQSDMLDLCAGWLRPGGRLVYATCSLLPVEGEAQIEKFLVRNDTMRPLDFDPQSCGMEPDWQPATGQLRLRPDYWVEQGGMDGFFMALMQKTSA
jgi:16S rRNA (cytosine967-C5)-methyltransferase